MKIVIEELPEGVEDEVIFKCHQMSPELLHIISILKAQDTMIAYEGNEIHRINPSDLYYIESVDNKVYIYDKEHVYESKRKLYELEESLVNINFLRVSKSVILNLSKIKSLSPALSGRFEASLDNGERVIISRQYVGDLKKRLGI